MVTASIDSAFDEFDALEERSESPGALKLAGGAEVGRAKRSSFSGDSSARAFC